MVLDFFTNTLELSQSGIYIRTCTMMPKIGLGPRRSYKGQWGDH